MNTEVKSNKFSKVFEIIESEQIMNVILERINIGNKGSSDYFILDPFEEIRIGLLENKTLSLLSEMLEYSPNHFDEINPNVMLQLYQIKIETTKFVFEKIQIILDDYSKRFLSTTTSKLYNLYQAYSESLLKMIQEDYELINHPELLTENHKKRILEKRIVNQ